MIWLMLNPIPRNEGPAQFIEGSNWVDVATDAGRTIGLKSDGTLWIPPFTWNTFTRPRMPIPRRFKLELTNATGETDWQAIDKRGYYSGPIYLLKTNHTLWEWSTMLSPYQTDKSEPPPPLPVQIGTDSDWAETFLCSDLLRKTDGTVWGISWNNEKIVFERETNLDEVNFQTPSRSRNSDEMAYIGKDGRLMVFNWKWPDIKLFVPCGSETNWVAVSVQWPQMTALKSDGTLWKWNLGYSPRDGETVHLNLTNISPTRVGIHNDWVAIGDSWYGTISLAADGSLWLWPSEGYYDMALMKLPKQPQFLGNVFGKVK